MPGHIPCPVMHGAQNIIENEIQMNKEQQNTPVQDEKSTSKFSGALPFILIFGGITVAMILIKLLMNLLG